MLLFIKPFCESTDNPFEMCVEHCECKYGSIVATRQELSDAGWVTADHRNYHGEPVHKLYVRCPECAEKIIDSCRASLSQNNEGYVIEDYRPNPFFTSFTQQPEVIEL